jgi:hypothetical protein
MYRHILIDGGIEHLVEPPDKLLSSKRVKLTVISRSGKIGKEDVNGHFGGTHQPAEEEIRDIAEKSCRTAESIVGILAVVKDVRSDIHVGGDVLLYLHGRLVLNTLPGDIKRTSESEETVDVKGDVGNGLLRLLGVEVYI